jgi:crotonobetainyl-CoA:carnitine CoA-transferase CaiB-like acyl-CoA transferase
VARALDGIRVIDLTVWLQGPVSAQFLADFGAEVIKVERPQGGDQGRGVRSIKSLEIGDWNQYFLVNNRNKKGLVIDLRKPEGQQIMYRLVAKADVFLSNMSPELLEGWNLSWEKLREINPRLVYATNTGYGRFGGASRPSFDLTVQALTGIMARLGEPGQPPIYLGMGSGDCYGGIMSAFAIVTALYQRNRSGHGQCIDASLYGAQLFLGAPQLQAYLGGDTEAALQRSRRDAPNPLWNIYPTRGKWVCVCEPNEDARFRLLCAALGDGELIEDPRFATPAARAANNSELIALFDAMSAALDHETLLAGLAANGVSAAPVNTLADVVKDPQAWDNDYLVKAWCEEVQREVDVRGLPVTLSKTPGEVNCLGPQLGQDTELLLMDLLEYSWDEIEAMKSAGAIP